jgi:cytochrome c5
MYRLSRRSCAVLLWLAIALLPVRGWAATLMPLAMGAPAKAFVATTGEQAQQASSAAAQAMPCHGTTTSEDPSVDGTVTTTTCSLCDLCHSTMVQAPTPPALPGSPDAAPPRATASSPFASRQPDGLFRPPRSTLA